MDDFRSVSKEKTRGSESKESEIKKRLLNSLERFRQSTKGKEHTLSSQSSFASAHWLFEGSEQEIKYFNPISLFDEVEATSEDEAIIEFSDEMSLIIFNYLQECFQFDLSDVEKTKIKTAIKKVLILQELCLAYPKFHHRAQHTFKLLFNILYFIMISPNTRNLLGRDGILDMINETLHHDIIVFMNYAGNSLATAKWLYNEILSGFLLSEADIVVIQGTQVIRGNEEGVYFEPKILQDIQKGDFDDLAIVKSSILTHFDTWSANFQEYMISAINVWTEEFLIKSLSSYIDLITDGYNKNPESLKLEFVKALKGVATVNKAIEVIHQFFSSHFPDNQGLDERITISLRSFLVFQSPVAYNFARNSRVTIDNLTTKGGVCAEIATELNDSTEVSEQLIAQTAILGMLVSDRFSESSYCDILEFVLSSKTQSEVMSIYNSWKANSSSPLNTLTLDHTFATRLAESKFEM